jgi:hypothetical protein
MTTTAFQYIFDNAESIGIDRRATVAQTITRDNTVRTVSRGGQVWRFDVSLPNGMPWDAARPYIEAIDYADRYTTGNVQMNNTGYTSWLNKYRGDGTTFAATWIQGETSITLTSGTASTYKFRVGDFIQLGSGGHVYTVVADANSAATTVNLNRAIIDVTGSGSLVIGPAVTWTVICTEMPSWTISSRNQVDWSGSFKFYEVLT